LHRNSRGNINKEEFIEEKKSVGELVNDIEMTALTTGAIAEP